MQFRRFGNKYFVRNRRGFLMKEGRKGFTLIELLIVIVVIGILSAMMMFSSTEAVSSAKASNVISNLRNLRTAITAWYLENTDKIEKGSTGAYLVRWSTNYQKNDDNLTPVQELWDSRVTRDGNVINSTTFKSQILRYMENPDRVTATNRKQNNNQNASVLGGYVLEDNGGNEKRSQWFIGYVVDNDSMKKKFAGRAKSLGLLQENKKNSKLYTNGDIVWVRVLSFE
ncbi:MAG: type II secretion system protein [Synergistaceae bacterium]|nr:type II secretion system protein [Synergistaceae bacterium]